MTAAGQYTPGETVQRVKREWMETYRRTGFEDLYEAEFDAMIEAVRAEEREKCAQIADRAASNWAMTYRQFAATEIAAAIRAQGEEQGNA